MTSQTPQPPSYKAARQSRRRIPSMKTLKAFELLSFWSLLTVLYSLHGKTFLLSKTKNPKNYAYYFIVGKTTLKRSI